MISFSQKQKEFLQQPLLANISVINSKTNQPIVFPAWIAEVNNKIYLSTGAESRKIKHLKINNKIGLNVVAKNNFPYLGVSGKAVFIYSSEGERFTLLREKIFKKYDPSGDFRQRMANNPDQMERLLIEITPESIYGGVK